MGEGAINALRHPKHLPLTLTFSPVTPNSIQGLKNTLKYDYDFS